MTSDNFVNRVEISGGKVQGFIQENHGTVTQNFITQVSELVSGQVSVTEKDLTREQYRQRIVLLSKVKDYWIKGVLEKSLYTEAMIKLGLEERSDLVERPFTGFEELSEESRESLPTGTGAAEFFDQIGDGRTLLILGEPGSGKTITLLKLAQNLIAYAEENVNRLIPVVFNLSSWRIRRQTIADWLLEELWSKYGVPKAVGKDWVEQQKLILLLDGLDEVRVEDREICVQAINQFMEDNGQTEVVVCSRIAEYEALSARLRLRGSIFIHSLTPEQINQYLDRVGEQLQAVKTLLQEDNELQELAKSPLMLSVMTLAYRGKKIEELPQTGSIEERRQHLFDSYIQRMFTQEKIGKPSEYKSPYQKQQTIMWLTWLGQCMTRESQTVFLIERIQTTWLQESYSKLSYFIGLKFISALIVGLSIGFLGIQDQTRSVSPLGFTGMLLSTLLFGLISGVCYGLFEGLIVCVNPKRNPQSRNLTSISTKIFIMLILSVIIGIIYGIIQDHFDWLFFGVFLGEEPGKLEFTYRSDLDTRWLNRIGASFLLCFILFLFDGLIYREIGTTESLKWSWLKARTYAFYGVLVGLIIGLIVGLIYGYRLAFIIKAGSFIEGLIEGLLYGGGFGGLLLGVMCGIIGGFCRQEGVETKTFPNQAIRKSLLNASVISGTWLTMSILISCLITLPFGGRINDILYVLVTFGFSGSLLIWLFAGEGSGLVCIKHFTLRCILWLNANIPWNYARFLDYATDRIFLRKVGGSYIFIHRMLQEHFARMSSI